MIHVGGWCAVVCGWKIMVDHQYWPMTVLTSHTKKVSCEASFINFLSFDIILCMFVVEGGGSHLTKSRAIVGA